MKRVIDYIQTSFDELFHKVSWPSWEELQKYTGLVMVGIAIITGLIWLMDILFNFIMTKFYISF